MASREALTCLLSSFLMKPLSTCRATTLVGPRAELSRAVQTALSTPPLTRDWGEEGRKGGREGGRGGEGRERREGEGGREREGGRRREREGREGREGSCTRAL